MDKKAISAHFIDALNKEDLPRREAARFLNLNPIYVTMVQYENSWDSMGKTAWERMEAWHETRQKISEFIIPEGEEIWKPKEKAQDAPRKDVIKHKKGKEKKTADAIIKKNMEENEIEEHSPENLTAESIASHFKIPPMKLSDLPHKTIDMNPGRLKISLDIEINLILNGQKIRLA